MNHQRKNTPPDPRDYDMYSAFRTKERGEARHAQHVQQTQQQTQKKSGYYDAYARRAEEEQAARREARRAEAARRRAAAEQQARSLETRTASAGRAAPAGRQVKTEVPLPGEAPRRSRQTPKDAPRTTRVQNDSADAYRYGYHSSYRTSDGRILDGFDAKGRPIYRDETASGSAAVMMRDPLVPDDVQTYRAPRRVRVETLADTDSKPFPFGIVFTALFCTGLIMVVLFAYMRLNEYTNTLSYLTYQLSGLRAETNTLQAELVRREDLLSIEQTASEILGMVKTDVLTKKYVTIENEDKTEVVAKLEEEAKRRTSVQIDLDTGKPMGDQQKGNAYIPPSETEAAAETQTPADTEAAEVTAPADTDEVITSES